MIDEFLKFQHKVEMRANALTQEMIKILMASREKILGKIAVTSELLEAWPSMDLLNKEKALQAQRAEVEKVLADIYKDFGIKIQNAGADVINATAKDTTRIFSEALGIEAKFFHLEKKFVKAWFQTYTVEGLLMTDWLQKIEKGAADRIISVARQAMVEGLTIQKTASLLRIKGIEGSRPGIEGLARTSMLSASNYARETTIKTQFKKDLKGWRYIATLDRRTCLVCGDNDGKFYKLDERRPIVPRHWRCRCVYIPVPKMPKGLKGPDFERAAVKDWPPKIVHHRDGSTSTKWIGYDAKPFKGTYNKWLTQQLKEDPAFVKSILGPTRFELFKSGKLKLPQMVVNGRIKRLSELRQGA